MPWTALPSQWRLLATRTTDYQHPDAPIGQQRGSGSLDSPEYYGGKYMILSAAPDDSYGLTEYPNYLYSPGYQVWDMTDPRTPSSSRRSPCRVRSWATRNTKRPI